MLISAQREERENKHSREHTVAFLCHGRTNTTGNTIPFPVNECQVYSNIKSVQFPLAFLHGPPSMSTGQLTRFRRTSVFQSGVCTVSFRVWVRPLNLNSTKNQSRTMLWRCRQRNPTLKRPPNSLISQIAKQAPSSRRLSSIARRGGHGAVSHPSQASHCKTGQQSKGKERRKKENMISTDHHVMQSKQGKTYLSLRACRCAIVGLAGELELLVFFNITTNTKHTKMDPPKTPAIKGMFIFFFSNSSVSGEPLCNASSACTFFSRVLAKVVAQQVAALQPAARQRTVEGRRSARGTSPAARQSKLLHRGKAPMRAVGSQLQSETRQNRNHKAKR